MTTTVYVAKNVYGGDGLGRLGDGRVVFVPGAWAGESVKAEIVEEKRHFVRARLVEVVEPSPDRLAADAVGPVVPGMVYAGLSYGAERAAKRQQLADFLERARLRAPSVGEIALPGEAVASAAGHYRNKVVYHFAKRRGAWIFGYREEPSHEIVEIAEDPLARPEINAALPEIRRSVNALLTQGAPSVRRAVEQKGNVTVRWSVRTGVKWWLGDAPADTVLKETTCGRVFEVPADGFYQVNPVAGDALVRAVVDAYRAGADATPDVLDLYCGVGVFALCCAGAAPAAARITGIESGRQAVAFAQRNAASQGVAARFFAEQVGRSLRKIKCGPKTTVIVDPPRGGLEPRVPEWLAQCGAGRVFYVSCDPATLVRDLRTLARAYDIASVRWVDMFPRTARFETLVTLERRAPTEG